MLVLLCCTCTNIGSLNYTDFNQLTLRSAIEAMLQQQPFLKGKIVEITRKWEWKAMKEQQK